MGCIPEVKDPWRSATYVLAVAGWVETPVVPMNGRDADGTLW